MKKIITFLFVLSSFISLQSRHIIGGTVEYTINSFGDNEVDMDVTFHIYRDVLSGGAEFDQDIAIGIYGNDGVSMSNYNFIRVRNTFPANIGPIDFDEILECVPTSVSFESAEYTINFKFDIEDYQLFKVVYQRCCRSDAVVNIQNGGETGIAITAAITRAGIMRLGTVKSFSNIFPATIPPNKEATFNFSINDELSRTYSLTSALTSGGIDGVNGGDPESCTGIVPSPYYCYPPYQSAAYIGGFGEYGLAEQVFLDSISGDYTVDFNIQGPYLVAIEAKAYDGEELLSTIYQQFVQVVTKCDPSNVVAHRDLSLEIYPMPTHGMIYIANPLTDIIIYNAQGARILTKSVFTTEFGIDVSNFSEGVYFLEGNDASGKKVIKRFIK
jgi:hypothetical protein